MSKIIWQILYNFFISPLVIFLAHIAAVFSRSVRDGLLPRYGVMREIDAWHPEAKTILFHAASLGEFEHIKPLLRILHDEYRTLNVVTFFSPSGYNHAQLPEAMNLRLYLPFDLPVLWQKLYGVLKPKMIIIAKHDVWPAQIWAARSYNIPVYLVNASLAENSSRTKWYIKSFLKHVYRDITTICTISEEDKMRFSKHYPRCTVTFIGDSKYDQVVLRKEAAKKQNLLPVPWVQHKWIFIAGSVWPEDTQHIIPALGLLLTRYQNLNVIIVPHQPHMREIERIESELSAWKSCKFSERDKLKNHRVLIVDTVGLLASLYNIAHVAYVGGSFKQGVHNVMEPAIYGIPVLYGPVHKNSYEAVHLIETGGGQVIHDHSDFEKSLESFIKDESMRRTTGEHAASFALKNTGATNKLLEIWKPILEEVN